MKFIAKSNFDRRYETIFGNILKNDPLIEIIELNTKRKNIIYDVGASHGAYSIYLGHKKSNYLIYSFEPLNSSYQQLIEHIALFKLQKKVIANNIALSDTCVKKTFYWSFDYARSSLLEFNATSNNNNVIQNVVVQCDTIDRLVTFENYFPPDIIKIDVEGHEYEVLKGAEQVIKKWKPKIFFEPHTIYNEASKLTESSENAVKEYLSQYGYNFKSLGYPIFCY